jgi:WD40 repeat protein
MPPLEDRIHPRQQAGASNEIDSLGFDASWSGLLAISANDLIEVQEQATGQSVISLNSNSGQKINLLRFEPGPDFITFLIFFI